MALTAEEQFQKYLAPSPLDDYPEVQEQTRRLIRMLMEIFPDIRDEWFAEGLKKKHEEGLKEGIEEGLKPLAHQFERRLGRALTDDEHRTLRERFDRLGSDRLGDVVLDLSPEALAAWLAEPNAM